MADRTVEEVMTRAPKCTISVSEGLPGAVALAQPPQPLTHLRWQRDNITGISRQPRGMSENKENPP